MRNVPRNAGVVQKEIKERLRVCVGRDILEHVFIDLGGGLREKGEKVELVKESTKSIVQGFTKDESAS